MSPEDQEIERLTGELSEYYHRPDLVNAKQAAERLATVLGEPTTECVRRYVHSWILIWEARGDLEEANRLQNIDIVRKRAQIESGDYNRYPHLLSEQIEYLQDSLY